MIFGYSILYAEKEVKIRGDIFFLEFRECVNQRKKAKMNSMG